MCNQIKPMSKEHFQYMKGIAILIVIIGHVGNFSGKTWFTPLGGIGVAMFLFCSGYGVMKSYQAKGLRRFWQNKLIAVYCPFVIVEDYSCCGRNALFTRCDFGIFIFEKITSLRLVSSISIYLLCSVLLWNSFYIQQEGAL